jgi:hypothetical protein
VMLYLAHNTRSERTRHERASLLTCVGEPFKRNVFRAADLSAAKKLLKHFFPSRFQVNS